MQSHGRVDLAVKTGTVRRSLHATQERRTEEAKPHHLVSLQKNLGNAHVSRMLAQREEIVEEELQAKHDTDSSHSSPEVGMEGGQISEDLSGRINSRRGGGTALDDGTRTQMESAFGSSFEDVRIHTDSEADSLNRSVSAKAFTTGSDIFFSQGASPSDSHLLAHELTHVVQQRGASESSGPMTVGAAGDQHEVAADHAAASVAAGGAVMREENLAMAEISREMPEEEEMPM